MLEGESLNEMCMEGFSFTNRGRNRYDNGVSKAF